MEQQLIECGAGLVAASAWPRRGERRGCRGFTLIEMMVVVSLLAILGCISIGPFRSVMDRNRIASEINGFVGDLQFARSEAITRGQPVTMCPSTNGTTCAGSASWHGGWIVFSDPTASGVVPNAAAVLRVRGGWNSKDTFVASAGTSITYGREGFSLKMPGASVVMRAQASVATANSTRCVSINRVGRQSVEASGTGDCA